LLPDRLRDLRRYDAVRLALPVANYVHEVGELVNPVLLEHIQVLWDDPLLDRVEGYVVGPSPHVSNPVIHGAGCHVQRVCHVLPEAVTHLVAGLPDVTRTPIFGRVEAVDEATHGRNPGFRKSGLRKEQVYGAAIAAIISKQEVREAAKIAARKRRIRGSFAVGFQSSVL